MDGVPGARWQDDEQLHLTLRFIGEVDRRARPRTSRSRSARSMRQRSSVALAGVGAFDKRGRDRHALGRRDARTRRWPRSTARSIRRCVRAGLPPERRAYLPHITLARLARGAGRRGRRSSAGWRSRRADERRPSRSAPDLYESISAMPARPVAGRALATVVTRSGRRRNQRRRAGFG